MLYLDMLFTFMKISLFSFGGGYAILAMIQQEVVLKHHWLSLAEFQDIVAISQMTPGPIAINAATF
ncbi:MAG TPA: chromate transporter, partial [Candidatus Cloacimonadota bacterium]|nr:chromate transporter [Candidatus Cloacimonadota bacterium]